MKAVTHTNFWELYTKLREKEGRLYSDGELLSLPNIGRHHPLSAEWQMRKRSTRRLVHYLERKWDQPSILEVGCGNGWLSRQLATVHGSRVMGIDINNHELQQAVRVFSHMPNLVFRLGEPTSNIVNGRAFDLIVFAASTQYFASLNSVLRHSLHLLRSGGEIHILDSPFYEEEEIEEAREKSRAYYDNLGFPEMAKHYFHHCFTELTPFHPKILYQPSPLQHYLFQNKNPFPWFCIKKQ